MRYFMLLIALLGLAAFPATSQATAIPPSPDSVQLEAVSGTFPDATGATVATLTKVIIGRNPDTATGTPAFRIEVTTTVKQLSSTNTDLGFIYSFKNLAKTTVDADGHTSSFYSGSPVTGFEGTLNHLYLTDFSYQVLDGGYKVKPSGKEVDVQRDDFDPTGPRLDIFLTKTVGGATTVLAVGDTLTVLIKTHVKSYRLGELDAQDHGAYNDNLHGTNSILVPAPEPSSMVLFGTGLFGVVGFLVWRRRMPALQA